MFAFDMLLMKATYLLTYNAPVYIKSKSTHSTHEKCCSWLHFFAVYSL